MTRKNRSFTIEMALIVEVKSTVDLKTTSVETHEAMIVDHVMKKVSGETKYNKKTKINIGVANYKISQTE